MGQAGRGDRLGVVAMQAREAALGGAPPDAVGSAGAKGLSRPSGAAGVSVAGVATAVAASGNPTRPAERGAPTAIPPAAAVADQLMVLKDFLEAQRFFFIASASAVRAVVPITSSAEPATTNWRPWSPGWAIA